MSVSVTVPADLRRETRDSIYAVLDNGIEPLEHRLGVGYEQDLAPSSEDLRSAARLLVHGADVLDALDRDTEAVSFDDEFAAAIAEEATGWADSITKDLGSSVQVDGDEQLVGRLEALASLFRSAAAERAAA